MFICYIIFAVTKYLKFLFVVQHISNLHQKVYPNHCQDQEMSAVKIQRFGMLRVCTKEFVVESRSKRNCFTVRR